jgi:hypothetical protein
VSGLRGDGGCHEFGSSPLLNHRYRFQSQICDCSAAIFGRVVDVAIVEAAGILVLGVEAP